MHLHFFIGCDDEGNRIATTATALLSRFDETKLRPKLGVDQCALRPELQSSSGGNSMRARHPTAIFFWGLLAALFLWASAAAFVPYSGRWPAVQGMMWSGSPTAGPGALRQMHMWGGGRPHILSQSGGPPQIADVERAMNEWIALEGNARLKPGPITERDSNSFSADIVTKDGSLVQRFSIDRRSGQLTPVED